MPRRPGSVTHWPSENGDCAVLFGKAFQPKDRNSRQIESISNLLLKSHGGMLRAVDLPRWAFLPAGSSRCSATSPWCYLVHLHLWKQGHFCFLIAKCLLGCLLVTCYEAPHVYWDGGGSAVTAPAQRLRSVPPSTPLALDKLISISGAFILWIIELLCLIALGEKRF